ncbi:alpha-D-ribose 1-methylphosphonate 5-triphosphate diphosphatase [Microbacterium sp.]|uniref:alpha-D-ribose 1-methylphosphonate 5-triphosphate diphosphatase n=1 Tax=Microbacterium sp. TaxID=51671 RepID=UPI003C75894D
MTQTQIDGITLAPGGGLPLLADARVSLDADGIVVDIDGTETTAFDADSPQRVLVPAGVDTHLDNMTERRRPRATVVLPQESVIATLDAEAASVGIGTVCIAARCEDAPGKGVHVEEAAELAATIERLAPQLACDWRIHVRVEVTDDSAVAALRDVLDVSSRAALISVMEHSIERSRFASAQEHREFYAADWGVPLEEVDEILAAKAAGGNERESRRLEVARIAAAAGLPLATHDDRDPEDINKAHALGAAVAEFPLTIDAARRAQELGMTTVLGAPNAVRGRSTSPSNILVADAVRAGAVDMLCCDYLPSALMAAPFALARDGVLPLASAVDLVSGNPAQALGLRRPDIRIGQPLTAALATVSGTTFVGEGLWREGRAVFQRSAAPARVATRV